MSAENELIREDGTRVCSMADALGIVGDRWSFQIIREVALGVRRFDAIQRYTGAPRQILTARLRKLEQLQVLTRVPYSERPPRFEYELTEPGSELLPVLAGLYAWGEKHATPRLGSDQPAATDGETP